MIKESKYPIEFQRIMANMRQENAEIDNTFEMTKVMHKYIKDNE